MVLTFKNSKGKKRVIAKNLTSRQDVYAAINSFLDKHNFKSYYTREVYDVNSVMFDVGSHTEFFYLNGDSNEIEKFRDNH